MELCGLCYEYIVDLLHYTQNKQFYSKNVVSQSKYTNPGYLFSKTVLYMLIKTTISSLCLCVKPQNKTGNCLLCFLFTNPMHSNTVCIRRTVPIELLLCIICTVPTILFRCTLSDQNTVKKYPT